MRPQIVDKEYLKYKLISIDTVAFNKYNYFEFKLNRTIYKVLSDKQYKDDCMSKQCSILKIGELYPLSLKTVLTVKFNDTMDVNLDKIRMVNDKRTLFIGGSPEETTYLGTNICGIYVCTVSQDVE